MPDPLEEVRRRRLIINRLDAWLYDEIRPYLGRPSWGRSPTVPPGSGHGNLIHHLLDRDLVVATDVEPSSVERVPWLGRRPARAVRRV
jgi:hypothetical protein